MRCIDGAMSYDEMSNILRISSAGTDQSQAVLRSMPKVIRQSDATRPTLQNRSIARRGCSSAGASKTARVRTFEIAFMAMTLHPAVDGGVSIRPWFQDTFAKGEIGAADTLEWFFG
jgi:hypothetical protein